MIDKKQIFEELKQYRITLNSKMNDFPEDVKRESDELLEVLAAATLSEAFFDSILLDLYSDNLHSKLLSEPSREDIKYILLVVASIFYERLLNGNGIETGGPTKALAKFVSLRPDDNDFDPVRHTVFLRAPFLLLTEQYKKFTLDLAAQKKEIEDHANSAASKVKDNVELLNSTDINLAEYVEKAKDLRSKLNFVILNKAFSDFIGAKEKIVRKLLYCLIGMGLLLLVIPIYAFTKYQTHSVYYVEPTPVTQASYSSAQNLKKPISAKITGKQDSNKNSEAENHINWSDIVNRLLNYLPLAVAELFLLFYFRILLTNYNSANAQLLQLKMRESVCQFIEEYITFKKTCNVDELEKFESLIFSNLMPSAEQIPPTFEGLDHLGKILGEFKPKKE